MRDHPYIRQKSLVHGVGYDDAEDLVRAQARRDPEAAKVVAEVDAARLQAKAAASALNAEMAARLGLPLAEAAKLASTLAADPELETWLLRRVNLERAHGRPPAHDEHPQNC